MTTKGMGEKVSIVAVEMKDWKAKQEVMKKQKRLGKNENKEVKGGYRKIKIQGKWYR